MTSIVVASVLLLVFGASCAWWLWTRTAQHITIIHGLTDATHNGTAVWAPGPIVSGTWAAEWAGVEFTLIEYTEGDMGLAWRDADGPGGKRVVHESAGPDGAAVRRLAAAVTRQLAEAEAG